MWRLVAGAALGTTIIVSTSVIVTGWRMAMVYPAYLKAMAYLQMARPSIVVSLRGMLFVLLRHEPRVWLFGLLSIVVVALAAWSWRDLHAGYSVAIVASLLTAYHCRITEMVLLLPPLAVVLTRIENPKILSRLAITILVAGYLALLTNWHVLFALLCYGVIIVGLYKTSKRPRTARTDVGELAQAVPLDLPLR